MKKSILHFACFILAIPAAFASETNEVVKDWIVQDVQFQKDRKIETSFSPEHVRKVVDDALALAGRIKSIPGVEAANLDALAESLQKLDIGTEPNECHGEQAGSGDLKVKHEFDLRGIPDTKHGWTRSYENLAKKYGFYFITTNGSIKRPVHGGSRTTAEKFGAAAAPLRPYLTSEHYGVELSAEDRHRVDLWLDGNSVFYGTYEHPRIQAMGKDVLPTLE